MYQRKQRSTERKAPPGELADASGQVPSTEQAGQLAFPLFAAPPFLTWYHRHRKLLLCQLLHPSVTPVILLWDEDEDAEPELQP